MFWFRPTYWAWHASMFVSGVWSSGKIPPRIYNFFLLFFGYYYWIIILVSISVVQGKGQGVYCLLYIISLIVGVVKDSFLGSLDLVYICYMSYSLCTYRRWMRWRVLDATFFSRLFLRYSDIYSWWFQNIFKRHGWGGVATAFWATLVYFIFSTWSSCCNEYDMNFC